MWIGDGCFCSPLGGRGLLSFVNLGPVGGAASALHLLSFHFFLFHPSVDGWREGGEGRREGWTGRLTDAQSAAQSMGTFAELR